MPVFLRDLIDLPDHVRQGDFVLRLSEGVIKPDETLRNYVVTPQLAKCFDEALGLIQSAVQGRSSKGAYLHGSFGSGKSHFMAVLLLLLEGNPQARARPELAATVARLDLWAKGKRFLLVPYHMIGARDLTSAVLGGYVDHVLRHHPGAPVPGVYRADAIFANARDLRKAMGDGAFFSKLNGAGEAAAPPVGAAEGQGWGKLDDAWDARSFEAALAAGPKDERRAHLVGALVANVLPALRGSAEFVDIDRGLAIISQHAKDLGYDGLILFLDELILWLASHAADVNFIAQEGQKLAKLVEAQNADRPTPIVSFIARQRDLRELVGDNMLGVQQVTFSDSLKHWDQRFDVVRLDDRNLPTIAEKRVLRPKSENARQQIDQAFRETEKIRKEVLDVLLTSQSTPLDFRAVYPFSPALMETLVALSSLLQRERTALKIMFQLLVTQRDTLQLGSIVPVGDLFDVIMRGDEPFSEVMKAHAEQAKKLYEQKLLPMIEQEHGVTRDEAAQLPREDARGAGFRRDDRLAKTLLLAALAPEVESFKGMTVNKLAALNHGTIRTPIPGREGQVVFERVRKWAAEIGQIRIGDETVNQSVTVQLTGVDTEGILSQAAAEDNDGNRVRKLKQLLFERLGLATEDALLIEHSFDWRATKRTCEVLFSNVRELNDESLHNQGERWKLIIDYPLDPDPAHTPKSDLDRIEKFRSANPQGARTLLWLPSFLSQAAKKDLGKLVVIDHVLTGARFEGYASRLSVIDRAQARAILTNQQSTLKVRVSEYLEHAYGVRPGGAAGILDTTHQIEPEDHVQSLHRDVVVRPPAAASLAQALAALLDQALAGQFPGHPSFEPEAKLGRSTVIRVWGELQKALGSPENRTMVDPAIRKEVRVIVTGLKLALMDEAHLVLDTHWRSHFERKIAQQGLAVPVTVAKLKTWLDEPKPMGLPTDLQNLILLVFAAQTNRAWFIHGSNPHPAAMEDLPNEAELKEQSLPDEPTWLRAVERASGVFGLAPASLRTATNAAKLTIELKAQTDALIESARDLLKELKARLAALGIGPESSARLKSAQQGLEMLEAVRIAPERDRIVIFANAPLEEKGVNVGTALRQAQTVARVLREAAWVLIESAAKLQDQRRSAGETILRRTKELLQHDELAQSLPPALRRLQEDAARLLAEASAPAPAPPGATSPLVTPPGTGSPANAGPAAGGPSTAQATAPARSAGRWTGSDEDEVRTFYGGQTDKIERNRRLVNELKQLYRNSQIQGDSLPLGLPKERLMEVLEVHHIVPLGQGGADERSNMLVVTPTLHALIHADPACVIDLKTSSLTLFGCRLKLAVHAGHNG